MEKKQIITEKDGKNYKEKKGNSTLGHQYNLDVEHHIRESGKQNYCTKKRTR